MVKFKLWPKMFQNCKLDEIENKLGVHAYLIKLNTYYKLPKFDKRLCIINNVYFCLQLTETVSADQSNDDSGSIGNVLNIVKNVVDKVGNLLNGNSESPNAT